MFLSDASTLFLKTADRFKCTDILLFVKYVHYFVPKKLTYLFKFAITLVAWYAINKITCYLSLFAVSH